MNIVEYSKKAHEAAKAKGWWDEPRTEQTRLLLVISEICECMEADRKARRAVVGWNYTHNVPDLDLSSETDRQYFRTEFEIDIKDTVEDELADTAIRILDLLGHQKISFLQEKFDSVKEITSGDLPTQLFRLVMGISNVEHLPYILKRIFLLAESLNINLIWHIEQKMKYNETRSHKHGGKAY